jgi:serine protease AprX
MRTVRLSLCFVLLLAAIGSLRPAAPVLQAQATASQKLDAALVTKINQSLPGTPIEVVVAFSDISAAARVRALSTTFFQMQALPMAGAILPVEQIQTIAGWPEVYSITYNAPLKYFLHESVPLVKADQVWRNYGQTGGNATVAIVDSGIDGTHPDLPMGSKLLNNVKIIPFGLTQENITLTDTSSGHGTHVAGTIGGNGAASSGYYLGVAPDVKLVGLGAGEAIAILTAVQAYDWILVHHDQYNIRVVSNSWGSTGGEINLRDPIAMATLEAYKQGILSVFAAGNDGGYDVMNPYSLPPWVLSVAAGYKDGKTLADFSSRGKDGDYFKHPDITAPGVNIVATRLRTVGITAEDAFPNPVNPLWTPSYAALSGTSMATPHVSGAAALLFSNNPQLSPDQVIDVLTSTATYMPGYALHEAGYGYMNVLAAFEASRALTGNLPAFLAGSRQHSDAEVLGFDPNSSAPTDEYNFSGLSAVSATGTAPIDFPFSVPQGALYVDARVTWTPQQQDAFDLEVLDPQGKVKVTSGNSVDSGGEAAFFVPDTFGTYTLRLQPFAGVAAQYQANVKVVYGTPPAGWPPKNPPSSSAYLGVKGIYKSFGVVGLVTDAFRSSDLGFISFNVASADGTPLAGQAANLVAVYSDRNGAVDFADNAIVEGSTAGEYQTSFDTGTAGWTAGPITVSFVWKGAGSLRALPTTFNLNKLATTLQTNGAQFSPGQIVSFSGDVAQVTTVATGTVQNTPVAGSTVTLTFKDAQGATLASTQVAANWQGHYAGTISAPGSARGQVTLTAESHYQDPVTAVGTKEWYGRAMTTLVFPGNIAPTVTLTATPDANRKSSSSFLVSIDATVSDLDGRADVATISLTLLDSKSRVLGRWSKSDFTAQDPTTWRFNKVPRVTGQSPWTVTITAQDKNGQVVTASKAIK